MMTEQSFHTSLFFEKRLTYFYIKNYYCIMDECFHIISSFGIPLQSIDSCDKIHKQIYTLQITDLCCILPLNDQY